MPVLASKTDAQLTILAFPLVPTAEMKNVFGHSKLAELEGTEGLEDVPEHAPNNKEKTTTGIKRDSKMRNRVDILTPYKHLHH
jgi:hypothetical protein